MISDKTPNMNEKVLSNKKKRRREGAGEGSEREAVNVASDQGLGHGHAYGTRLCSSAADMRAHKPSLGRYITWEISFRVVFSDDKSSPSCAA